MIHGGFEIFTAKPRENAPNMVTLGAFTGQFFVLLCEVFAFIFFFLTNI